MAEMCHCSVEPSLNPAFIHNSFTQTERPASVAKRAARLAGLHGPSPLTQPAVKKSPKPPPKRDGKANGFIVPFLTTEPNKEVAAIHPKAITVILTKQDEIETRMIAPNEEALTLQRPLPDGALQIVARGAKTD